MRAGILLLFALTASASVPAEALEQVLSHQPLPRFGNAALEPPKPQYRTRAPISEYAFLAQAPKAAATQQPAPAPAAVQKTAAPTGQKAAAPAAPALAAAQKTAAPTGPKAAAPAAQPVACPETLTVTETADAPGGWRPASAKAPHPFERISVFNGTQGAKEYDLAPDDEKARGRAVVQTWFLKDYRTMNLFLRCRYHGTGATLSIDLPAPLQVCSFSFELAKDGAITGKRSVVCH